MQLTPHPISKIHITKFNEPAQQSPDIPSLGTDAVLLWDLRFHSHESEDYCLLKRDIIQSGRNIPTFFLETCCPFYIKVEVASSFEMLYLPTSLYVTTQKT